MGDAGLYSHFLAKMSRPKGSLPPAKLLTFGEQTCFAGSYPASPIKKHGINAVLKMVDFEKFLALFIPGDFFEFNCAVLG